MTWEIGDRLSHRLNVDLGAGQVVENEGRVVVVHFPRANQTLRLAADSEALEPLVLKVGAHVRHLLSGENAVIESFLPDGRVRLANGWEGANDEIWPDEVGKNLLERLEAGDVDSLEAFSLRLDALRLAALREADGLGSFLGGRIRLFPHQLYVAERATRSDPVRWLLADEVGLGKTVESCLILNHLLHTRRADRILVVAPETLTVQWLGELWRKYHQVFVLLDTKRLEDVEKDYGEGFNPFDAFRRVIVSQERLESTPRLSEMAVEAAVDVMVVDEAHHLRRPPGHPGNPSYRAVAPITAAARHVLLLTAVPLEDDAHGFFRLLQLLRGQELSSSADFEEYLGEGRELPPCTSATRRRDIGGLPPRRGIPVDLADDDSWTAQEAPVEWLCGPQGGTLSDRQRASMILRALSWPAALASGASHSRDPELSELAAAAGACDPRVAWLRVSAAAWERADERTLVFVADLETLEALREALRQRSGLRVGTFHEQMSAKQRDIEVAQFRLAAGPSILISTECGGEGRNFEFCTRLVLFDLPWNPIVVEQRIGRLDRIGRRQPVEIVYFRPPRGLGATVTRFYERLGLFERPLGSLEPELRGVEKAIESLALSPVALGDPREGDLERLLEAARAALDRIEGAAYAELHRAPYRPEMAESILARVPAELEELTRKVVLAACHELGLQVEEHREGARHWIELDARARVESLPGLPGEHSFLGTFYREEAVEDETIDYFASGHPLVEGILAHLDESSLGRAALLDVFGESGGRQLGLLAIYKNGGGFEAFAFDAQGREHPEWRQRLTDPELSAPRVRRDAWVAQSAWPQLITALGRALEGRGRPEAVAAFRAPD